MCIRDSRLLCGDVGVGKTEVALRAAFKCVMGGKQFAILAPTTILAWQHLNTALTRMESFPIRSGLLSRYRTPKEQKETLRGLKDGTVDIVVGTQDVYKRQVSSCCVRTSPATYRACRIYWS